MGETKLNYLKPKLIIRFKCMSCRDKFYFKKGYKVKSKVSGVDIYYCIECAEEIKKKSRV